MTRLGLGELASDEVVTYWIAESGPHSVSVFFRNNDTECDEANFSKRSGLLRVFRCRLWARRNGCGWPEYRRPSARCPECGVPTGSDHLSHCSHR